MKHLAVATVARRWTLLRFNPVYAVASVATLILFFAGCGKPDPADRYVRPDQVTDFHTLFGKNCSGCHGMDGQLGPAPPLNDSLFQAIISDEQLTSLVKHGREGTLMPAFAISAGGTLTDTQCKILVNGIRKQWAKPDIEAKSDLPGYQVTAKDPAGIDHGDVRAGAETFAATCAGCHGEEGRGGDNGSIADRALAELISDQMLRRIIITGRPDLDMPNYIDYGKQSKLDRPLSNQDIIDVAAYVRSLQRDPPPQNQQQP